MRYEYNVDKRLFIQEENWQSGMPGIIYVRDEFDMDMAASFIAELHSLCHTGQDIIPIVINSPGGDVYALMEMVDALENCGKKILTYVSGHAMSAGAFLAACGDQGLRFASQNSDLMVHQMSSGVVGKTEDIVSFADGAKRVNDHLFKMLDRKTGQKEGYWRELLKINDHADLFLSPSQALTHNLINHIGAPKMTVEVSVKITVK
jgi:ATP-dependent Clp protease protease subunit